MLLYVCQPYHLFEPFLDLSLPIAFEDEWEKAVSVSHFIFVILFVFCQFRYV